MSLPALVNPNTLPAAATLARLLEAPSAVPFDPSQAALPLQFWFRAKDLALANGASVSSWTDLSGNGRHATPPGTAPTLVTNAINGQAAVQFAATPTHLVTPSFLDSSYNSGFSVFVLLKYTAGSLPGIRVLLSNSGTVCYCGINSGAGAPVVSNFSGRSPQSRTYSEAGNSPLLAYLRTTTTTREVGDQRGSTAGADTGSLGMSGALTIGNLSTGGFPWPGLIAEVFGYAGYVSDADLASIKTYANALYGLS